MLEFLLDSQLKFSWDYEFISSPLSYMEDIPSFNRKVKSFLLEGKIRPIAGLFHYYRSIVQFLNSNDWEIVITNKELNFFEFVKKVRDYSREVDPVWGNIGFTGYYFQTYFKENHYRLIREKVIESIKTENLEAVLILMEIWGGEFFSEIETRKLIQDHCIYGGMAKERLLM